jgi:predicted GIY-YIG superfamily endonuclease
MSVIRVIDEALDSFRANGLASGKLQSFWLDEWKSLKPVASPVVYFLVDDAEILYVGASINLKQRWACHHLLSRLRRYKKKRFCILYSTCDQNWMYCIERNCINSLKPKWNRTRQENVHQENKRLRTRIAELEAEVASLKQTLDEI